MISAGYKITWDKGAEGEEGEEGAGEGEVRKWMRRFYVNMKNIFLRTFGDNVIVSQGE